MTEVSANLNQQTVTACSKHGREALKLRGKISYLTPNHRFDGLHKPSSTLINENLKEAPNMQLAHASQLENKEHIPDCQLFGKSIPFQKTPFIDFPIQSKVKSEENEENEEIMSITDNGLRIPELQPRQMTKTPSFALSAKNEKQFHCKQHIETEKTLRFSLQNPHSNFLTQLMHKEHCYQPDSESESEIENNLSPETDNRISFNKLKTCSSVSKKTKSKTKAHLDSDERENDETIYDQSDAMELQEIVFSTLDSLHQKVYQMEVDMLMKQEKVRMELLQKQLLLKNAEIERIQREESLMRNQRNIPTNQNLSFNYFVLFLLGMLLVKLFLC